MSEVNFTEESTAPLARSREARGLYKLAIQMGLAKDEQGARVVLILVAVVAIIIAIAFPILFG